MTKQLKRKKEIKNLFNRIKSNFDFNGIPLSITVKEKGKANSLACDYTILSGIKKITVIVSINSIKKRVKEGYLDDYYKGRAKKINPFILGNRHLTYRFIILHEISHAIDLIKNYGFEKYCKLDDITRETSADDNALNNLKRF